MKRYLIVLLAILVLTSGVLVACAQKSETPASPTPEQITATQLKSYCQEALPIMKRHTETTETTNQANRSFLKAFASGDQKEVLKALTVYRDTLDWALNRVDDELLDYKKLMPPPEARQLRSLMIEGLLKEQAGLTKVLSYYSSVLSYGFGYDKELNDGDALLLEAQKIWLQAQYELQDLMQKLE